MAKILSYFHPSCRRELTFPLLHVPQALLELLPAPLRLLHRQPALAEALGNWDKVDILPSLYSRLKGDKFVTKLINDQQDVLFRLYGTMAVLFRGQGGGRHARLGPPHR